MTHPDLSKIDFGEHAATASAASLEQLSDLVDQLEQAERDLVEAQAVLAQRDARLKGIIEHELPEMMQELKQPVLHTSDGRQIKITDIVRGTLPAAMRPLGFKWLMENQQAGLIKRTVEVAFAAVEGEKAQDLLSDLEDQFGANARETMKVEASTLLSFIKKQLKAQEVKDYNGPIIPTDIFSIKKFKHAKVSKK